MTLGELSNAYPEGEEAVAARVLEACRTIARLDRRVLRVAEDAVDDVASDAAMRILVRLSARTAPSDVRLGAWVRRVVALTSRDWLRVDARQRGFGPSRRNGSSASPSRGRRAPAASFLLRLSGDESWLSERQRAVVRGLNAGATEREVAESLGVSHSTVHEVARRLAARVDRAGGGPRRPSTRDADWARGVLADRRDELRPGDVPLLELRTRGLSVNEVAHALGRSRNAVKKHFSRIHRRSVARGEGPSPEQDT